MGPFPTPRTLGTSGYLRNSAASTLFTIVAPAANVNGILVTGGFMFKSGAGDSYRLMYKTSAPSAWNDATAIGIRFMVAASGEIGLEIDTFIVPPGYGLYEQANGSAVNTGCDLNYRVL